MAKALIIEFEGVDREGYDAVNAALGGIDTTSPTADWPAGLARHMAGATATGWTVIEVWDSAASAGQFMESRLGAALRQAGMPPPARQTWVDLVADTQIG